MDDGILAGLRIIKNLYKSANGSCRVGVGISGLMGVLSEGDSEGFLEEVDNLCKLGFCEKKPLAIGGPLSFLYLTEQGKKGYEDSLKKPTQTIQPTQSTQPTS